MPGVAPTALAESRAAPPVAPGPLTTTRTVSRDVDADGIADYRVIITETFDEAGNLVARTKARDDDADGIVDSQVTTRFDQPLAGGP